MRIIIFLLINIFISNYLFGQFKSKIVQIDSTKCELIIYNDSIISKKLFFYKVLKHYQADIDKDGKDEIILGVYKSTILDSVKRYRINIWQLDSNQIVPKWLGSFLPHPIFDFDIIKLNNEFLIRTIEFEENNLFLISEYRWHSFGLKYIRSLVKNVTLDEAKKTLNILK